MGSNRAQGAALVATAAGGTGADRAMLRRRVGAAAKAALDGDPPAANLTTTFLPKGPGPQGYHQGNADQHDQDDERAEVKSDHGAFAFSTCQPKVTSTHSSSASRFSKG